MKSGKIFGEIALKSSAPRGATLVCAADCIVLTLDKPDFQSIFASGLQATVDKEIFFKDMFSNVDQSNLKNFHYYFKLCKFRRNRIIYHEKEKINKIYIISEGEIALYKKRDKDPKNVKNQKKEAEVINLPPKNMLWKSKEQLVDIVGRYCIIGEEYINGKHISNYTAVAMSSPTIVYGVDATEFMGTEKNIKAEFRLFREISKSKLIFRNERNELLKKVQDEKDYRQTHELPYEREREKLVHDEEKINKYYSIQPKKNLLNRKVG